MKRDLPPWWSVLYYGLLLGTLFLFAELAEGIYAVEGFAFDSAILSWLFEQQSPLLTRLALALDLLGISYFLGALTVVAALLVWSRSRSSSLFLILGFWGAVGVNLVAKEFFERVRPDLFEQLTPITNSSFPSGHAMGSFAFWLTCWLVVSRLAPGWRWFAGIVGCLFAVGVGASRLYLQVHYPSDVLAGWALSTAWVMGIALWYTHGFRHLSPVEVTPVVQAASPESPSSEPLPPIPVEPH